MPSVVKFTSFVGSMSELLSWLRFSPGNNCHTADGTAEMLLGCTNGQAERESMGTVWHVCRSTRELNCCCGKWRDGTLQVSIGPRLYFLLGFVSLP